jgi:hypothetical protein
VEDGFDVFLVFSSTARMYVCWVLVHKTDTSPHLPFVDTSRRWLGVEMYCTVYVGVRAWRRGYGVGLVLAMMGICEAGDDEIKNARKSAMLLQNAISRLVLVLLGGRISVLGRVVRFF